MSNTPKMSEVLRMALDARLQDVHVALPGRVESYSDSTQRAIVQPLIKRGYPDETGARAVELLPAIADVPVVFPGSGGRRIKWTIEAGDIVLLVFCSASIDQWLAKGGEVDPADDRRHSLSDAIAIPGLQQSASDASPMIEFTDTQIRAGGSSALALKSDLETLKTAITTALDAVAAGDGGLAAFTSLQTSLSLWPTGTTVLKGS